VTDIEIALQFFERLKRKGVDIRESYDNGREFTVHSTGSVPGETITFCFRDDESYDRIMGYVGNIQVPCFFIDDVHKT
jgi:hypothetical protein